MKLTPTPVYVVSGFLDSGKTTFLNRLFSYSDFRNRRILILQFESGEEELSKTLASSLSFSREELENAPGQIVERIACLLRDRTFDEVWVEWNGMAPFAQLQDLLSVPALHRSCRLEKVLYLADGDTLELLLGQTGGVIAEQIANCDLAIVKNADELNNLRRFKRLMRSINPGLTIFRSDSEKGILNKIYEEKFYPVSTFCIGLIVALTVYHFIAKPFFHLSGTLLNTLANIFLGILLQAIPFFLIGVLISSGIQTFVSADTIRRKFPRNPALGMLTAVLLGFCFPVCDCASVPIFRSLVKKGVPVPVAVTFLTVTPVINPVVMLSTYYAFSGNLRIVAVRVGLGILASVLIGLSFYLRRDGETLLPGGFDSVLCSCGYYEGTAPKNGWREKVTLFLRHSQAEFFSIGKYLMLGAFCSSLFQTLGIGSRLPKDHVGFVLSLLLMMVLAFFLSLCSSSDAVIARSFSTSLPLPAAMGFLVFGPMMDLKNFLMLSGGFSRKFVGRLALSAFLICFFVVFLFARLLLGG